MMMVGTRKTLSDHDLYELNFVLKCTPFLVDLSNEQRNEIITERTTCIEYAAGTSWITEGMPTIPALYVILSGQALLKRHGEKAVVFFSASRFGQELLQMGEELPDEEMVQSPYTIQAKTNCTCAQITLADMRRVFQIDQVHKGVAVDKSFRRKDLKLKMVGQQQQQQQQREPTQSNTTQNQTKEKTTASTKQRSKKKSSEKDKKSSKESKKKKSYPSSSSSPASPRKEKDESPTKDDTQVTKTLTPTSDVKSNTLIPVTTSTTAKSEPIPTKPVEIIKVKEPSTTATTTKLDTSNDKIDTINTKEKQKNFKKASHNKNDKEKKFSNSLTQTRPVVTVSSTTAPSTTTLSTTTNTPSTPAPVAAGRVKTSRRSSLTNTSTHSVESTGIRKAPRRASLFSGSMHQTPLAPVSVSPQSPKKIIARSDVSWLKLNRDSPTKTTIHVVGKLGDTSFGCRIDDDSFGFLANSSHHSGGEPDVIREVPSRSGPSQKTHEDSASGSTQESDEQEMDVSDLVPDMTTTTSMTLEESLQGSKLNGSMQGSKLNESMEGSKIRFQSSLSKFENANTEIHLDTSARSSTSQGARKRIITPRKETIQQGDTVLKSIEAETKIRAPESEPPRPEQSTSGISSDPKPEAEENVKLPEAASPVSASSRQHEQMNKIGKLKSNFEGRRTQQANCEKTLHRPRPPANVSQMPLVVKSTYKPPQFEKSQQEERQISRALSKCFAFKSMPKKNMKALIAAFERQDVEAGREITLGKTMKEDNLYVVADGEVSVNVDNEHVASVKPGEIFGEENLFHAPAVKRDVSIVTTMKTNLFKVNQTDYRSILQIETKALDRRKRELLDRLPYLRTTSQEDKRKIANVMKHITFDKGKTIPTEGNDGKILYVVDEGTVRCRQKPDEPGRTMRAGQAFGETAFMKPGTGDEPVQAFAETEVSAFFIDMKSFEKAVGPVVKDMIPDSAAYMRGLDSIIKTNKSLRFSRQKELTETEQKTLLSCFKDRSFEKGDIILEAKQEVHACLYFLRHGMVEAHTSGRQRTVQFIMSGTVFAEKLFNSAKNAKSITGESTERFVAGEQCIVSMLLVEDYLRILNEFSIKRDRIKAAFQSTRSSDESESSQSENSDSERDGDEDIGIRKNDSETKPIKLEHLEKKAILGEGGFGQVWLVRDTTDSDPKGYALKIQSKHELILSGDAEVAVREKNIMAALGHPNVIKLLASYQDADFLYFLLNLVQGGELYSLLYPVDGDGDEPVVLPEEQAKFYAFGIADALAHVHEKGFVYRDMKPENVMIDAHGYPILVDFGLAKFIENGEKTFTLRGTPGYLPPECILNVGHSFSADHWSLGVLIYELLCGDSPFFFFGIEQVELYRSIVEDGYPALKSSTPAAASMIDGLLTKDPSLRLGSLEKGELDIIKHEWFEGLDVESMRERKLEAPWKPNIKDPFDTSSFENWDDLKDKTKQSFPAVSPKDARTFERF